MKIPSVGTQLFHADRQTKTYTTKLLVPLFVILGMRLLRNKSIRFWNVL